MDKNIRLKNKNVILTGAGGILGQKLSQAYLDAGANIALLDIDDNAIKRLNKNLVVKNKNKFHIFKVDITNKTEIDGVIKKILQKFITIDVLHNNAATKGKSLKEFLEKFEDYKLSTWNEIMNGNLNSMFLMSQAVGKIMKKNNSGSIIQTASLYGVVNPDQDIYNGSLYNGRKISSPAVYSVSKASVIALTKYLASYWGKYNIRVNSISPGGIYSGQNETFVKKYSKKVPLGRMAQEKDVIGMTLFLASDVSSYITGQNILIDGGFSL